MIGEEDDESDEGPVTEVEMISDVPLIEVEGAEVSDSNAEESDADVEASGVGVVEVSEAAAELEGVEVGEGVATLLVEGPVPMGTS